MEEQNRNKETAPGEARRPSSVEEAEAAGLHIARPGLELQQGVRLDLEALQVALNLGRGQPPE